MWQVAGKIISRIGRIRLRTGSNGKRTRREARTGIIETRTGSNVWRTEGIEIKTGLIQHRTGRTGTRCILNSIKCWSERIVSGAGWIVFKSITERIKYDIWDQDQSSV